MTGGRPTSPTQDVDVSIYYTMVGKPRHLVVTEADLPSNAEFSGADRRPLE